MQSDVEIHSDPEMQSENESSRGARRRDVVSVRDGWTISSVLWFAALALLLSGGRGDAQNLVTNPGFTSDLTGWSRSGFEGIWNPEDADGDPNSGSGYLLLEGGPRGGAFLASLCIPVVTGTTYDVRADLRLPVLQGASTVDLSMRAYSTPTCLGSSSGGVTEAFRLRSNESTGAWTPFDGQFTPGQGVSAIRIEVGATKSVEVDAEYFVDKVAFCVEGTCDEGGPIGGEVCQQDESTACLLSGRFEVTVEWTDFESNTGMGKLMEFEGARAESEDSAFFYFFTPTNFEIGVKMVDACSPPFDRFWVFTSGLTNVAFLVRVVDTETGVERAYGNPLGMLPQTQGDTSAFLCD